MAYSAIDKSSLFMNPLLYTGNGTTSHAITGLGFQPDWCFIKNRETTDVPNISTSVNGVNKYLITSTTDSLQSGSQNLLSFDADGFTVGTDNQFNQSADGYVSWNLKAGTTSGIATNGSTTITPSSYSFNQTSGFSILAYTGNVTSGAKLAHGLGAVPKMVIIKNYNSGSEGWSVYHTSLGNTHYIKLNTLAGSVDNVNRWNDTDPDSVNITLGDDPSVNGSTTMVAYCFAAIKGYSKFGQYTGNANADGTFVYTGFRPAFVLIKGTPGSYNWNLFDNKRPGYNPTDPPLWPNSSVAQSDPYPIDILSNGFKAKTSSSQVGAAINYIYMAFGQSLVGSNGVVGTAF